MNKELEQSIEILIKENPTWKKEEAIVLLKNYIDNSIPKQLVEKKIKKLSNTKGDFATYIATSERIKVLQELLEGK